LTRRWRSSRIIARRFITHTRTIEAPIVDHAAVCAGVETLKWLVVSSTTAPTMMACSMPRASAVTAPIVRTRRRWPSMSVSSHSRVAP